MKTLLHLSVDLLPAPFLCPGCLSADWRGICKSCIRSIRRNIELLPSSTSEIEAFAPILYSFQPAHGLLKYWKEHRGHHLESILFRMDERLRHKLLDLNLDAVIPIPQAFDRSWRRGHESAQATAGYFARKLSLPVRKAIQLQDEPTSKQALFDSFERNQAPNPFRTVPQMRPWLQRLKPNARVLIADDLITSGNTLIRATEALRTERPDLRLWAGSLGYRPQRNRQKNRRPFQ